MLIDEQPGAMDIQFPASSWSTARYASATTVLEEALVSTRLIGRYWSATGQVQRENIASSLPGLDPLEYPLQVFELEIDGQSLHNRWELVGQAERDGARVGTREAVITLRHQVRPITVAVITRLDGTPFLTRRLAVTNTGDRPAALAHVSPWSGLLWNTNLFERPLSPSTLSPYTLGYMQASCEGHEGNFVWEPLYPGRRRIESLRGISGYGNPWAILRNEITGEMAMIALAWSGNWYLDLWRNPNVRTAQLTATNNGVLTFRMGPHGVAPQRVIAPTECIVTPEVHLGLLHTGFDAGVALWHDHLRASVIPPRPEGKRYFSIAGRVVEEPGEWTLQEINIAAEMGVDAFMVDAGWYGRSFTEWWKQRGDWTEGDWLPGGLAACRACAHQHNMLFGLWMEPESVGTESELYREHPEWLAKTNTEDIIEAPGWSAALDLAHPAAAQFMRESILRVIRELQVDFFKIDYNYHLREGAQHDCDGYVEHESWRHYEALYETFDQILREMPHVALENCAGGGGRNDLGMISRTHYTCESDYSTFPRSIRALNAFTLYLPPEALVYYHNHMAHAHQMADLETHLRVTLFAQPIFVGFGAQNADRHTPYFDMTKRYIRLIKEVTGPIIAGQPTVYHHTPDIGLAQPAPWCVLEYAARDQQCGFAGVFRIGDGENRYLFHPRGVDGAKRYIVTMLNSGLIHEVDGAELRWQGLPIELDAINTSELILYRVVE